MIIYRQPFSGDYRISLDFDEVYEPYYTKEKPHKGIDYLCPAETPILAAADGWVLTIAYEPNGYGNYVILLHDDGSGTVYAHLHKVTAPFNGKVQKGDVIGYSGNTGKSTGPHLHFEARAEAGKISTVFDPKLRMQSVVDYIPAPFTLIPEPSPASKKEKIDGGLCEVVCDAANIRDVNTFLVKGQLFRGAKIVISPDVVWYNDLPYHKIMDDYMLIAEYDHFDTQILSQIDK